MASSKSARKAVHDLYWQYPRVDRRTGQSTMPVVLRDLGPRPGWPGASFDPAAAWERDQAERSGSLQAPAKGFASSSPAPKNPAPGNPAPNESAPNKVNRPAPNGHATAKGRPKARGASKKDAIIEANLARRRRQDEARDLEKLEAFRSRGWTGLLEARMTTPLGRLQRDLEVLDGVMAAEPRSRYLDAVALDCLWSLEATPLFTEAEAAAAAAPPGAAAGAQSAAGGAAAGAAAAMERFRQGLRRARRLRDAMDDVYSFQLSAMGDRLPPLSPFGAGQAIRLDDWQRKVLALIDARQSCVVCAPTSSGKTIISSYAAIRGGRVLFVVPTEALVWQVAALFHAMLSGGVALCTTELAYCPRGGPPQVLVGTPSALESRLTKPRGILGAEAQRKHDYAVLPAGFDGYDYAVFDDVHTLDGEDGAALQRLVRTVDCCVLALSAAIDNAEEIVDWWRSAKGFARPPADFQVVAAPQPRLLGLEEHRGRFINLQRFVWGPEGLSPLHPCGALTPEFLLSEDDDFMHDVSLAFTPWDSHRLWEALACEFGATAEAVAGLAPRTFFASRFPDSPRMGLNEVRDYELALKTRLRTLCLDPACFPRVAAVLATFRPALREASVDVYTLARALAGASGHDIEDSGFAPALIFCRSSFETNEAAMSLLYALERAEAEEQPRWQRELSRKAAVQEKHAKAQQRARERNPKAWMEEQRSGAASASAAPEACAEGDEGEPHADFVFHSAQHRRVGAAEYAELIAELRSDQMPPTHPWLRALRRGFGVFVQGASFGAYRRVVQRLAQAGKLAFVFSDESLAFGVNMPFRTVVFLGMTPEYMSPLLAQQMSGRAGRRGLDTRGNIVYVNMTWDLIRALTIARIEPLRGRDPRYPTQALQRALCLRNDDRWPERGFFGLTSQEKQEELCALPLQDFCIAEGTDPDARADPEGYATATRRFCHSLGLLDDQGEAVRNQPRGVLALLWELRHDVRSSLALWQCLPLLLRYFRTAAADDTGRQTEMAFVLMFLLDRHPHDPDFYAFHGAGPDLAGLPFMKKSERREWVFAHLLELLDSGQGVLASAALDAGPIAGMATLDLALDAKLDPSLFVAFSKSSIRSLRGLSSRARHTLQGRLRRFGERVRLLHNCLNRSLGYGSITPLLRKVFLKVRYMVRDALSDAPVDKLGAAKAAAMDDPPPAGEHGIGPAGGSQDNSADAPGGSDIDGSADVPKRRVLLPTAPPWDEDVAAWEEAAVGDGVHENEGHIT